VRFFERKRLQLIQLQGRHYLRVVDVGLRGPGRAEWYTKAEAELLFFNLTRYGGARDAKRPGKATQAASFLIDVQDPLEASFGIGMGSWVLAALPSARAAAIELLAIGCMTIAHQSVALTVRAVQGNRHH
jgi:hypothetical protein